MLLVYDDEYQAARAVAGIGENWRSVTAALTG
jgi:hypothetical protein